MIDDDTEHYEPQRVVSPYTSPSRGEWGWAPGHPYSRPELPGTSATLVYLIVLAFLGLTVLMALVVFGVLR